MCINIFSRLFRRKPKTFQTLEIMEAKLLHKYKNSDGSYDLFYVCRVYHDTHTKYKVVFVKDEKSEIPEIPRAIMALINFERGHYLSTRYGHYFNADELDDTPLSKTQRQSLDYYKGYGYIDLAQYLERRNTESFVYMQEMEKHIRNLDTAFSPITKEVVVYRADIARDKPSKSYTSTTLLLERAAYFTYKGNGKARVRAYKLPKGTFVITSGNIREVILPRNFDISKYEIK